ncbi:NUDIX hydrolase [Nocardioides pantholopis]|uniref:NUDIX hydrolase n=1 Tax=Nocardioides pantholopis TaxID=2483798 RepID=UPI001F49E63E|nr:NUDIX hydrolase [Nocardioides pantholopis]
MTPAPTPAPTGEPGLHADALSTLTAWTPPTRTQATLRDRYVAHLRERPDAMSRTCRPDHLTASTLVLSADRSRVLLTLHAKAGRWFQFGGHCEAGDTTLAGAALREATEESGLDGLVLGPRPVQLSEHPVEFCGPADGGPTVHHLDVRYVAVAAPEARHAVSEESLDVRWWPARALPDPDADLVELVELALQSTSQADPAGQPG